MTGAKAMTHETADNENDRPTMREDERQQGA